MSKALELAHTFQDLLTPEEKTSKLTFTKYNGDAILKYIKKEISSISKNDKIVVTLLLNPEAIEYSEPKRTEIVQTSQPGRFVIFDWGTQLLSLTIRGNTGNLLPESITNRFDITKNTAFDAISRITGTQSDLMSQMTSVKNVTDEMSSFLSRAMVGTMTYDEIIAMSSKYKVFQDLRNMYKTFDGDKDIIIMELGMNVYRGFFSDFSFTVEANNPWNYKYSLSFIVLDTLSAFTGREDEDYNLSVIG